MFLLNYFHYEYGKGDLTTPPPFHLTFSLLQSLCLKRSYQGIAICVHLTSISFGIFQTIK